MATLGFIRTKMKKTYNISKISAGKLIAKVRIAKELPECLNMTAEEKIQRERDIRHIVDEIVPCIIEDPDRFFSSLIVDIYYGFDAIRFEPISKVVKDIPDVYAIPMEDIGFITLSGKERLIALDG